MGIIGQGHIYVLISSRKSDYAKSPKLSQSGKTSFIKFKFPIIPKVFQFELHTSSDFVLTLADHVFIEEIICETFCK